MGCEDCRNQKEVFGDVLSKAENQISYDELTQEQKNLLEVAEGKNINKKDITGGNEGE